MNKSTAYHEAGHAVAFLKLGFTIDHVSILPTQKVNGYVMLNQNGLLDYRQCHKQVIGLYAGFVAESYFTRGAAELGYSFSDMLEIQRVVSFLHNEKRQERVLRILVTKSQAFVQRHKTAILAVAEALMRSTVLNQRSLKKIIRRAETDNVSTFVRPPW